MYINDLDPVSKQDTPLEVYFRDQKQQTIALSDETPEENTDIKPDKNIKFKANKAQRTDLEETWKRSAPSNNSSTFLNSKGKKQEAIVLKEKSKQKGGGKVSKKTTENGDYKVSDSKSDRRPLDLPGFGDTSPAPQVPSYIQAQMPEGIRLGNVTALNADQYKYYSFNRRLATRFIPIWGSKVRKALYQWLQDNNFPPVSKSWITQLEVIMNEKGEIIDIQPFRLSGLWDIDRAAIDSFKRVGNVPNPPQEMVDENGYIHLQFQTEVLWVPQPGVRFQGGGPGQRSN